MGMDRNTIIGFVLLALLFFGYFYYSRQGQTAAEAQAKIEKAKKDSIDALNKPKADTLLAKTDSIRNDSARRTAAAGAFVVASKGTEQLPVLENDLIKITFTNKGAQPRLVELKKYRSYDSTNVKLVNTTTGFDKLSYNVNTGNNQAGATTDFYFETGTATKNADGSQSLAFTIKDTAGQYITHTYTLKAGSYMLDLAIEMGGAANLLTNSTMNIIWQNRTVQHEKDKHYEKQQSQIVWLQEGDYDYMNAMSSDNKEFTKPINWVSSKQQFFNTTLIAKNNFSNGKIEVKASEDSSATINSSTANLQVQVPAGNKVVVPFQFYYGPNDYRILKASGMQMENIVNLGQGMFAFVKYLNRWIVMPVFHFFSKFISSYGLVIALLTLFIRLLISPLTYRSYLSGAKMKALRPEIDALKKKHGSDQQAFGMEQMKLFRSAGVSPLGGCIPALLQIPIFFALYSFFNSSLELRGQGFLWAKDLSVYDSIFDFGNIPVISSLYGNHISLFTITAVITSFLISLYSMSMTPDQNNPVLKYMPYFFPIILLGVFNRLPSALTWYYTVSNVVTLALQFVIQNYIIDHDKILAKLEENKKKPKAKSKWQEKIEQMQETQKRVQEAKNKGSKK
jgi:YidC/Oxa1 family membrane protein insertase